MAAHPQPGLTPEQYLAVERTAEYRREYCEGKTYWMEAESFDQALIKRNLTRVLKLVAVALTSAMRVRAANLWTHPDLTVEASEPKFMDANQGTLLNPIFIAEVFSPSTEAYDRGFKFARYREVDSLAEFALISEHEPRVEVYRRRSDNSWLLSEAVSLESTIRFITGNCSVALRDLYEGVIFEEPC